MKWIGLTGGIGTGKSTVASLLRERGYLVADADEFSRQAISPDLVLRQLVPKFGKEILNSAGELDRARLGRVVFSDKNKLLELETIIHPIVKNKTAEFRKQAEASGAKMAFYDVPLLFEKDMASQFDKIIAVVSDEKIQRERLIQIRLWQESEVKSRLASQLTLSEKINRSDFVIHNNGSMKDLENELDRVLKLIGD